MASLIYVAEKGTYEDFLKEYVPEDATRRSAGDRTLLFKSLANKDIKARVAITTRLLDDGADPSVESGGINALHVMFARPPHDAKLEAPMLGRLLDGGADVNLVSKRFGPPLMCLITNDTAPEVDIVPFYDVFFSRPDLDLSVPSMRGGKSVREFVLNTGWNLPLLRERVLAYDRSRDGVA